MTIEFMIPSIVIHTPETSMSKITLQATASIVALIAGNCLAAAQPAKVLFGKATSFRAQTDAKMLYGQNSNDTGEAITSENLTGGSSSAYTDQGADDFVIPTGKTWTITEVDVTGAYGNGPGPATSENVIFYKNRSGMPGKAVRHGTFTNLNGTGGPNFSLVLPGKGLTLTAGHYWVSVVANIDFDFYGVWGWETNGSQHRKQALWENPNGGYDICRTWGTLEDCTGSGPDFMFVLGGTSN